MITNFTEPSSPRICFYLGFPLCSQIEGPISVLTISRGQMGNIG